jgi:hypothetical protein
MEMPTCGKQVTADEQLFCYVMSGHMGLNAGARVHVGMGQSWLI